MTDTFGSLGFDLIMVLAGGAFLWLLLWALRWALNVIPMNKERRALLERASPIIGALVALSYLLFAARSVFRGQPAALPFVLALVVAGFSAAAWPTIRDFLAGVALKAGRVCHAGDHVRIGDVEGKILSLGYRVLVLETTSGDQAILPYSRVAKEAVVRTRSLGGVTPHKFRVGRLPAGSFAEARAQVIEAALLCHWCAFAREPEVAPVGDGGADVTVFALDPSHGPDIEAAVRSRLGEALPELEKAEPVKQLGAG